MCNVCLIEKHLKKSPSSYTQRNLYVKSNKTLNVNLCYVHDVEFFVMGARRFFEKYPKFYEWSKKRSKTLGGASDNLFDFDD